MTTKTPKCSIIRCAFSATVLSLLCVLLIRSFFLAHLTLILTAPSCPCSLFLRCSFRTCPYSSGHRSPRRNSVALQHERRRYPIQPCVPVICYHHTIRSANTANSMLFSAHNTLRTYMHTLVLSCLGANAAFLYLSRRTYRESVREEKQSRIILLLFISLSNLLCLFSFQASCVVLHFPCILS